MATAGKVCKLIGARGLLAAAGLVSMTSAANADVAYGVTQQQRLIRFDTATPGTIDLGVAISGLASNESIQGIDFRPNQGLLYGLGSQNNLYTINITSGAATFVSALSIPLDGASFGFDFNPTGPVGLRIVSNTDKNYRIGNPAMGGVVTQDTDLAYIAGDSGFGVNPNITHVAYTNSFPGATSTTLYGIDAGRDVLVRFASPNAGTLQTVGTLGMGTDANINVIGGFDISAISGIGYAAVQNASLSESTLWTIDLATGAGASLGSIGGGETLVAFALAGGNIPAPSAGLLAALGALAVSRRRR